MDATGLWLPWSTRMQLREEEDPPTIKSSTQNGQCQGKPRDLLVSLGHRVSEKLEEGGFKAAIRLHAQRTAWQIGVQPLSQLLR